MSYAGSDIARGEALLRAGTVIGSREIGMLRGLRDRARFPSRASRASP